MAVLDDQPTEALLDARYRLIERVGAGGSAEVHKAEDVLLGRIVAIKLLRAEREAVFGAERVHVETAVLASLNHPSIVTLFDAQLDPGRPQYLVMEYVEGETLSRRLDAGPLHEREAATLALDLAAALDALHRRGVVHRDVKPSNVLLGAPVRRGERWTAKLADFGIAHVLDDPRMTTPGMIVGTAAYMAPEQITKGDPGAASDVYSLGLVLLEALTGTPAYPRSGGVQSALARLSAPPEIPISLGPEWTLLLTRMTRTDPAERPSAAAVLAEASALAGVVQTSAAAVAAGAQSQSGRDAVDAAETRAFADETGETRVLPSGASSPADAGRGASRRFRIGATVLVCAIVLSIAGVGGVWALGARDEPPAKLFSGVPFVKTPAVAPSDDSGTSGNDEGDDDGENGKDPKDKGGDDPGNSDDKGNESGGKGKEKDR